jgi:c-di-AMP phosphodiesterase-like protein
MNEDLPFEYSNCFYNSLWIICGYCIVFSLLEKIKKEHFVINYTNTKTRKVLLNIINQSPFPIVLVDKKGDLSLYNVPFINMLIEMLNFKSIPDSIFKVTEGDKGSTDRLLELI